MFDFPVITAAELEALAACNCPVCDGSYAFLYGANRRLHIRCPCANYRLAMETSCDWKWPAIALNGHWMIFYREQVLAEGDSIVELKLCKKKLRLRD